MELSVLSIFDIKLSKHHLDMQCLDVGALKEELQLLVEKCLRMGQ